MRVPLWLVALSLQITAQSPPVSLRSSLVAQRKHAGEHSETRGATVELTSSKRLLRDWIESRLTPLHQADEEVVLASRLNAELESAGLFCDNQAFTTKTRCPEEGPVGYLGEISIHRSGGFLVVQTTLRIDCGVDQSAYIYDWKDNHWKRIWQSEQDVYTEDKYLPQELQIVQVSPDDYSPDGDKTQHLIVTVGERSWCMSGWRPIYSRVWRVRSDGSQPKQLLDESEFGYIANPIHAAVQPQDVLVEYAVSSIDPAVHTAPRFITTP